MSGTGLDQVNNVDINAYLVQVGDEFYGYAHLMHESIQF